jgi:hypothetical protein
MTRIGIKAGFVVIVMFVLFAMNCFYIKKKALVKISTKPTSSDFQYNVTRMKMLILGVEHFDLSHLSFSRLLRNYTYF